MQSRTAFANSSVMSPFFTWPFEYLHHEPRKHLPNTLFQHRNDCPVGWQYLVRVGKSVNRLPQAVRISERQTNLLYLVRYGSISSFIFGWRTSSLCCSGFVGVVATGSAAGGVHWVGGLPCGMPPRGVPLATWGVIHSRGNIALWIGIAFWTESIMLSRCDVENWKLVPDAKSDATGLRPKNECPSSMMAHVMRAQTSLV